LPFSIQITENLYQNDNEIESRKLLQQATGQVNPAERYLSTRFFLDVLKENQPDAVYCADYHGMIAARMYYDLTKTPYSIDNHEFCLSHQNYHMKEQFFVKRVEEKCFEYATTISTVSQTFAELYKFEYGLRDLPLVYYNTPKPIVDFTSKSKSVDLRKILQIETDAKILLFHGGLAKVKRNLEMLLGIATDLKEKDIHLLFIGYGPLVEDILKVRTSNPKVHYIQTLNQETLAVVIKQVDAIIVPYIALDINQKYCAPNRFFDALANRTFVIANESIVSIKAMIDTFNVGYAGPMDTHEKMYETIINAFEFKDKNTMYDQAEKIDMLFGFDAQKQTILTISSKLKSQIHQKEIEALNLVSVFALLETQVRYLVGQKDFEKAKDLIARFQYLSNVGSKDLQTLLCLIPSQTETDTIKSTNTEE
jgi:hypothetical protein